jgi:FlaA1/EpsC-like NDP-sugar epimerase
MSARHISRQALRQPARWRQGLCAALLAPVFLLVHAAAYALRFDFQIPPTRISQFLVTAGCAVAIKLIVFGWFRVYRGWSRYVTFHDVVTLGKAALVSSFALILAVYLVFPGLPVPRSVTVSDFVITIAAVGGLRSLVRLVQERHSHLFGARAGGTAVFIVGANDSGEALLRMIRRSPQLGYRVVGFVSRDVRSVGTQIGGVPVIATLDDACLFAAQLGVVEILVTSDALTGHQMRALCEGGRERGVLVKVLPSYEQMLRGSVNLRPRTVSIEDLLRREPVRLDQAALHSWIDGRVLLVTGSAGSIGSEICRQLLQFAPRKLVLVDRSETGQFFLERELRRLAPHAEIEICLGDVCDGPRMNSLFVKHRPDIVFHAAAYKHVPLMEAHPGEAVKNICVATRMLADLAHQRGVQSFVMISTDKAVNPTSIMGACKRISELYVQALAESSTCRFVTVRFGNVLDSAGSVVPIFRQQIEDGGPVTVTDPEMRRYFMTIPEASQLVIQAGAMGQGGEIFVLDMGRPVRILDLAEDMIRFSGLEPGRDIDIEFSGIRPGEKLFEELHTRSERHRPTAHPKIVVAADDPGDLTELRSALADLSDLTEQSPVLIRDRIELLVPELRWQRELAAPSFVRAG